MKGAAFALLLVLQESSRYALRTLALPVENVSGEELRPPLTTSTDLQAK